MATNEAQCHAELIARLNDDFGLQLDWEAVLEAAYRRFLRSGDVVADIGAHVGRHLRPLAQIVGPAGLALAFEPLPFAFETLRALDLGPAVTLHNVALSDISGRSRFVYAEGTPEESGLRQRIYNAPDLARPREIEVEVRLLDEVVTDLPRLDYVKIDAEGGELNILRGAAETLRRLRPIISVEYGMPGYTAYGHTPDTLFDFAAAHGYVLCDLFGASVPTPEAWRHVCDRAAWDWFMVPAERLERWQEAMRAPLNGSPMQPAPAKHPEAELQSVQSEAATLRAELSAMRRSTSWRLTAPLRALRGG